MVRAVPRGSRNSIFLHFMTVVLGISSRRPSAITFLYIKIWGRESFSKSKRSRLPSVGLAMEAVLLELERVFTARPPEAGNANVVGIVYANNVIFRFKRKEL